MNKTKKTILAIVLMVYIILFMSFFYFQPSVGIVEGSGTVLSDNWWEALNWIKNNTNECAVIATYWDPGHFITGIAERPVIFDGATQNSAIYLQSNDTGPKHLITENYDKGITQIILEGENSSQRARIKDIGIILYTGNESLALKYLKDYKKPGCSEMYFIASADLVGKSHWWTYFATWNPIDKGNAITYRPVSRSQAKPIISENTIVHTFYVGEDASGQIHQYIIYEKNQSYSAYYQVGNNFYTVNKLVYLGDGLLRTFDNAEVSGTILLWPNKNYLIHIPAELEDSMFTKMFFFDGQGLKNFEYVNNWGGEVKLFRVKFDSQ